MEYETLELNYEARKILPGEFIQLSKGHVHYEFAGEGDTVILVHGFSSPLFIWDPTFDFLVKEGFRVLRYDLYGRGYSERPKIKYSMEVFVEQLVELTKQLNLDDFSLVGLSMGGGVCVVFADKYPVKKVSLIYPIGFSLGRNILLSIMKIPLLNSLMLKLYLSHSRILEMQKEDFWKYNKIEDYLEKYADQMKYKGFLRAIRSTALHTPFTNLKETYERLGKKNIPMQLFWGENDQTIPYSTSKLVCEAVPDIEFHTINNSGHIPHFTHPNEVNPLLVNFLRG